MKVKTLYSELEIIHKGGQELVESSVDATFQTRFGICLSLLKPMELERTKFLQDIIDGKIKGAEARRIAIQKFT